MSNAVADRAARSPLPASAAPADFPPQPGGQHPERFSWAADLRASVVVFLVALPLCLGIALASGAPLLSGIISGIVGGIVVGIFSPSALMVSGPAAGLAAIVLSAIATLGSFELFLAAVVLGGLIQLGLGLGGLGVISYYFPSSVIKGMLAAIGIILILKQIPHALGYDADAFGDQSFWQMTGENTFTAIAHAFGAIQPGAVIVAAVGLAVLILWQYPAFARLRVIPAPLMVVLLAVGLNALFAGVAPGLVIESSHLVQLPVPATPLAVLDMFTFPAWSGALTSPEVWRIGVTLAIVASLETLLSVEATDKMDPFKRQTPTSRELVAQGIGNTVSGLIGGLPITGVIVRSSANVDAGAQTKRSAIAHGVLLLVAVAAIPMLLNLIPLAALAAVLLYTGFKLAHPKLWRAAWRVGRDHFIPFAVTILAILLTDLLVGIIIGLAVGIFFILREHARTSMFIRVSPPGAVLTRFQLPTQATFLGKANVATTLADIPPGSRVEIDARNTNRIDYDVLELLLDFEKTAKLKNIDYRLVGVPDAVTTPSH